MREVIKEGRDVNEAIELACTQLGVERGQVNFEILELPKKGVLGVFFKKAAKVRVFVEEAEAPRKRIEKPAARTETKTGMRTENRFVPPAQQKPQQQPLKTVVSVPQKPGEPVVCKGPKVVVPVVAEKQQETKTHEVNAISKEPTEIQKTVQSEEMVRFTPMDETQGKVRIACDYVKSVLLEMGVDAKLTVGQTENGVIVRLSGDGLGVVIGRRGETLDSLQYLSGLVANRCEGDYLRVTIDTGNYREKRERTLQQLAKKLSASALRSGRSTMLEPMNPYERRIIHSTVSMIDGVSSSSVGDEPNRRVVISPVNMKPRYPKKSGPSGTYSGTAGVGSPGGRKPQSPGGRRPPRFQDNNNNEFRERTPRPDRGERIEMKPASAPTSTAVDREYAKELERQPQQFTKPSNTTKVEEKNCSNREKTKDEAENLPLYGKIDL